MAVKKLWKDSMVRSLPTQKQAGEPLVDLDLVDQGRVFVAFGVLNFIYTNGADRLQGAMFQASADHILDGVAHLVPGSVERLSRFLPGELPRPAGPETAYRLGSTGACHRPREPARTPPSNSASPPAFVA
jgi:hypothetical protein